jgi:hypothetical protein
MSVPTMFQLWPADNWKKYSKKQIPKIQDILRIQYIIQNKTQFEIVNFRLYFKVIFRQNNCLKNSVWRWLWNKVENLQSQTASCFELYSILNSQDVLYFRNLFFTICFNLNRIHDSVGKALKTANLGRVQLPTRILSITYVMCIQCFHLCKFRVNISLPYRTRNTFLEIAVFKYYARVLAAKLCEENNHSRTNIESTGRNSYVWEDYSQLHFTKHWMLSPGTLVSFCGNINIQFFILYFENAIRSQCCRYCLSNLTALSTLNSPQPSQLSLANWPVHSREFSRLCTGYSKQDMTSKRLISSTQSRVNY